MSFMIGTAMTADRVAGRPLIDILDKVADSSPDKRGLGSAKTFRKGL